MKTVTQTILYRQALIKVVPDPVLSADNTDIVWRIFPAMISQSSQPMSEIGRKSSIPIPSKQCCEESYNDKLCLIAWEVDAPSHSHNRNDGTLRDSHIIPIADFVDPMKTYNLRQHRIIADEDRRRTVAEQKSHSTSAYPL